MTVPGTDSGRVVPVRTATGLGWPSADGVPSGGLGWPGDDEHEERA